MNHYELLAILSGKFAETELEDITKKIDALLAKCNSTIHYMQHLGRKKLAYPINGLGYGYYVVYEFDGNALDIEKIDRELRLSGDLLRHLITSRDEVGAPKLYDKKEPEITRTQSEIPAELRSVFSEDTIDTSVETVRVPVASVASQPVITGETEEKTPAAQVEETPESIPQPVVAKPKEEITIEDAPSSTEESPKKKKKDEKMNYEDLDKKLDELLKNDIL